MNMLKLSREELESEDLEEGLFPRPVTQDLKNRRKVEHLPDYSY